MKIYTKKGDQGFTSLFGGTTLSKDNLRVAAYGAVDELNSVLGCVISEITDKSLQQQFLILQKQLFIVGSELACLNPSEPMKLGFIQMSHVETLEQTIDQMETKLSPLKKFILPGGSKASSFLHLARTVCRRAERDVVSLSHREILRKEIIIYLNRLSDLLFVAARFVNQKLDIPDQLWEGILSSDE